MRSLCLSEFFDARRTGYLVPRNLPRCWLSPHPRSIPTRAFPTQFDSSGSSSLRLQPPSETHQVAALSRRQQQAAHAVRWPPPLRFSAPPASKHSESASHRSSDLSAAQRHLGSTRSTVPPRPFSDPRGFNPHHALWPCFVPLTLLGFLLSKAFFLTVALPDSSSGDTLSTFLLQFLPPASRCFSLKAAPSGLYATFRLVPTVRSIASVRKAESFLSFYHLHGFLVSRVETAFEVTFSSNSSAHGLDFRPVQARFFR